MDIATKFWSNVNKKGPVHPVLKTRCWLWTKAKQSDGYGSTWIQGKSELAHRVAWFLIYGKWPTPCGLHKCDNPPCCNPDHLFEGTDQDNSNDKIRKGRFNALSGIKNGRAKLRLIDIEKIRKEYGTGRTSHRKLAVKYQVNQSHIARIVRGKAWANA